MRFGVLLLVYLDIITQKGWKNTHKTNKNTPTNQTRQRNEQWQIPSTIHHLPLLCHFRERFVCNLVQHISQHFVHTATQNRVEIQYGGEGSGERRFKGFHICLALCHKCLLKIVDTCSGGMCVVIVMKKRASENWEEEKKVEREDDCHSVVSYRLQKRTRDFLMSSLTPLAKHFWNFSKATNMHLSTT